MITPDVLKKDERFYIDEWNINRVLALPVAKYDVVKIRVGNIIRELEGKIYSLYETDVYQYINGDNDARARYEEYCARFCYGNTNRGAKQFDELIESMKAHPYNIKKGALVVNQYNMIQEGQHRACILLYLYGPDYEVEVVRLVYSGLRVKQRIRFLDWKIKRWLKER